MKRTILIFFLIMGFIVFIIYKPLAISNGSLYYRIERVGHYNLYKDVMIMSEACEMAYEEIYEEEEYIYRFSCIKSHWYIVKKGNQTFTVQEAFQQEDINRDALSEILHIDKHKKMHWEMNRNND